MRTTTGAVLLMLAGTLCAQSFPAKPIRVYTAEAGGGADVVARLIAQGLTASFNRQVIVENQGAASGAVAAQAVAKSPPDGYTLLFFGSGIWLLPYLRANVPYDPVRDFTAITLADRSPTVLVVHPSLPVRSVRELIALAKAHPGELNYASGSTGAAPHLAAELFNSMAKVRITRVNYKGTGPALNDLVGGQVQLMFTTTGTGLAQVKSGRLRALGVTSREPSALAPGIPTIAASGVPGYEADSTHGLLAPAGTPPAIVELLNQETVRVLNRADVKEKLLAVGVEAVGTTPASFAATIKDDMAKWGKLIREVGIRAD
jgi:tripartite-type tricarboxylate transporter receptor subunit TctC